MKTSRMPIVFWVVFCVPLFVWGQGVELSTSSQLLARGRWIGGITNQLQALYLSSTNFLGKVSNVFPLPVGMTPVAIKTTFYVSMNEDFVDCEYQLVAQVSNADMEAVISWQYGLSGNERMYNLMKSIPYLSQSSYWVRIETNRGNVVTLWREKDTYYYFRVLEEKDSNLLRGFLIKTDVRPFKKLSVTNIENFVWEYVTKTDWSSLERLLR